MSIWQELKYLNEDICFNDKIVSIEDLRSLNESYFTEMVNIKRSKTGLPYDLWIDDIGINRGNEHTHIPRLKVNVDGRLIPFLISDNPDIPDSVKKTGVKDIPNSKKVRDYIIAYKKIINSLLYAANG